MSKEREIWLIKSGDGNTFHPFADSDYETAKRIKPMVETCFKITHIRSPLFHRKYFALINLAFENQHHYSDIYVFRKTMEMRAGYYIPVKSERGNEFSIPKSISYNELDQTDFEKLYDSVWQEISKMLNLVKEEDKEMFLDELARFA